MICLLMRLVEWVAPQFLSPIHAKFIELFFDLYALYFLRLCYKVYLKLDLSLNI